MRSASADLGQQMAKSGAAHLVAQGVLGGQFFPYVRTVSIISGEFRYFFMINPFADRFFCIVPSTLSPD